MKVRTVLTGRQDRCEQHGGQDYRFPLAVGQVETNDDEGLNDYVGVQWLEDGTWEEKLDVEVEDAIKWGVQWMDDGT